MKLRILVDSVQKIAANVACKERVHLILVFLSPSLDLATNKWHALSLMSIEYLKDGLDQCLFKAGCIWYNFQV